MTEPLPTGGAEPLGALPRLPAEALAACPFCQRTMLQTPTPIFYRLTVQYCGIDQAAVREHVGLGMMLGGTNAAMAIADVMGAHKPPVVEMSKGTVNVCLQCAQERIEIIGLTGYALEGNGNV